AGDAAALLVGKVEDVLGGMKAKVAWPQVFCRLDLERCVGGQMAGAFVEPELENRVGTVPRNVRHEGKLIGGIGLDGGGACGLFRPFDGSAPDRAVSPERMDRGTGALIIGGQQNPALAICRQIGGRGLRRYRPALRQPAGVRVDAEAGY